MKTKLTPHELKNLSALLKLDEVFLLQLNDNGVLDSTTSRAILIKAEYRKISCDSKLLKQNIVLQLARKYTLSVSAIEVIIYSKTVNKHCSCKVCEAKMTKYKSNKNGGVCDNCIPI